MCKLKGYGKRCPETPQRKTVESYRQKVKYQAKKEGISSQEWLKTERGHEFSNKNDPRVLNPNWHQEHQESIAQLKSNHPQVTMSDDFLAKPQELSIIKSNFPKKDTVRGREEMAHLPLGLYRYKVATQIQEFTEDEISGIHTYSTSSYKPINNILRNIEPNMDEEKYRKKFYPYGEFEDYQRSDKRIRKAIENIDSALSHRRETAEVSYRCMTTKQSTTESLEEYKPNTVINFEGYTSTSHSPLMAMNFSDLMPEYDDNGDAVIDEKSKSLKYEVNEYAPSNHSIMFEVQSNAGQPIAIHSQIDTEREILMPRGMYFKVVDSYVASKDEPYQVDHKGSGDENIKKTIGKVENKLVVVQLVECDKDGNIVSPNTKVPYQPSPLPLPSNAK